MPPAVCLCVVTAGGREYWTHDNDEINLFPYKHVLLNYSQQHIHYLCVRMYISCTNLLDKYDVVSLSKQMAFTKKSVEQNAGWLISQYSTVCTLHACMMLTCKVHI